MKRKSSSLNKGIEASVSENILGDKVDNVLIIDSFNLKILNKFIQCFKNEENKNKIICFTGNRPSGLPWKYNEDCDLCMNFKEDLKSLLVCLYENGFKKYIVGVAMGFDLIVAEILLDIKNNMKLNINIECAVPCLNQVERWPIVYKNRYNQVLNSADNVFYVSESDYYNGCYQKRNQYMVDKSLLVVAALFKENGGTKSTVDYARKKHKNLIIFTNLQ